MRAANLRAILREAWGRDTSADPKNWTTENPAWGQCAVTSLVVQDYLGGELRRALVNGISHYWVRLPDGTELDWTREQFTPPLEIEDEQPRTRDYALSDDKTAARYEALAAYVDASIKRRIMRKLLGV